MQPHCFNPWKMKPCGVEAEPTFSKDRFFLYTLLKVRAVLREPRWEYLLILGSSTVTPATSEPCRLCEQDPGYTGPCRNLSHGGSAGSQSVLCMDRPCCTLLDRCGLRAETGPVPTRVSLVWICSGVPVTGLQTGTHLCLGSAFCVGKRKGKAISNACLLCDFPSLRLHQLPSIQWITASPEFMCSHTFSLKTLSSQFCVFQAAPCNPSCLPILRLPLLPAS